MGGLNQTAKIYKQENTKEQSETPFNQVSLHFRRRRKKLPLDIFMK